jgi:hypothetical protein
LTRQLLREETLKVEIHNLYVQQAANKRLRSLVKQFIIGINMAILIQIEKLNKPKLSKQNPVSLEGDLDQVELLARIKLYDMDRYYKSKTAHPISYRLLHGLYTGLYGLLKSATRAIIKSTKRLSHG